MLKVHEGDALPRSKADVEEQLDAIPGVVEAHLEAVCCDAGRMILYVGIEEKGAPHFDVREAPDGDYQLPEEITKTYQKYLAAERSGSGREDLTQGHPLSANPDAREIQQQFIPIAKRYLPDMRRALRESGDEDQRATAAYVLNYAPEKNVIVNDLQFALKDNDQGVRAVAAHGLKALAVYARLHPDAGYKIEPTWFIEMLNSLSWADRSQAIEMLLNLTDQPNPAAIEQIRDRALPALIEMAHWKALTHALPPFLLLGRVAGLSDQQVQDAWTKGDRESVIALATGKKKK